MKPIASRNRKPKDIKKIINTVSSLYKVANKFYQEQLKTYNNITLKQIDKMTGEQFELFLANLFTKAGYTVRSTPTTGDYGADLLLFSGTSLTVVQAKRSSSNVGVSAVQEVVASKPIYSADHAIVVSNAEFTSQAKTLAQANGVQLIGRQDLANLVRRYFSR